MGEGGTHTEDGLSCRSFLFVCLGVFLLFCFCFFVCGVVFLSVFLMSGMFPSKQNIPDLSDFSLPFYLSILL